MDNKTILEKLGQYVVGHDEAKKVLITMIARSYLRHFQKYIKGVDDEFLLSPMKILLIGASGSGKTHLLESLQKILHFPLVRVDATQLIPAGGGGGTNALNLQKAIVTEAREQCEMFPHLYYSVEGAIDKTIVFIDEVDKLGTSWESSGNWNKHVQSNFLTTLDNKDEFAGVSFVMAGAFNEITKAKVIKNTIGFHKGEHKKELSLLDDEIVKSGLIPELVGRITYIVELDKFDAAMYLHILKQKLLPKKRMDLAAYGLMDADISDAELENIALLASKSNQGVRYLHRALDRHFLPLEFDASLHHAIYQDFA